MKTFTAALLLFASALFAQTTPPLSVPTESMRAIPLDAKIDTLAIDLQALQRIANLAKNLNDNRQVLLAIADADIEALRIRNDDGTYKWASLQRVEGGRVTDEKAIEQVQTEKELRNVTVTAPNVYRVAVVVPQKRNLVSANNRVYVRNVIVDSTGFDGKTIHQEIPVNAWVNPGDTNAVALTEIGKSVKATAELGVESGSKRAVAQVALLQATLVDNPDSPYYPAVKRLLQIREFVAAEEMPRGPLKNAIDEAILAVPGELEKRAAEQERAAAVRKDMLATGTLKGSIVAGDATTDVVKELAEINRLIAGSLDEQNEARTRLQTLLGNLAPTPVVTAPTPAP